MNQVQQAVKIGAQYTIQTLMETLKEEGAGACINLLIEMDNQFATGQYDRLVEKVTV
jgi:hypothetical protein